MRRGRIYMKIEFSADKVKVKSGNEDGGAIVSFYIGEYMLQQIEKLVSVERGKMLKVSIEIE